MHRHIEDRREKINKKMPKIIQTIPDTKPIFRLRSFSIFLVQLFLCQEIRIGVLKRPLANIVVATTMEARDHAIHRAGRA